ncbi:MULTISPECIES: amidohydrolase family protein [unclassified Paenibacillus]|uniref:amidohydrolase family protein n=1 Tax=unclassified Paenibacillus TaxID=185978 RepID=UPI001AE31B4E|nr:MULTISPECIES: amidohydrolase family protein [unclassified Paenibacillus]MBP1155398.1 4-oxalmesaconate hydratase [Paenibacillus sp. PvP091]MBP1169217.1 4-oxalmesaconate hydratase [Paenibacillus sp. PvR098]MBP2440245.1 4-oxalmesaconate hydratase [Paenibacillus sp. PvP052]
MIIDIHGHTTAPAEVYAYQARLLASRGNPDSGPPKISDDLLETNLQGHVKLMNEVGTDLQLISPRPYHVMHSMKPSSIIHQWTGFVNDIIARQCKLYPNLFQGVAGLPQSMDEGIDRSIYELERCVKELGFVGCLINPDPAEGGHPTAPAMGDEYWYPLYEKMVELGVPGLVHSAACCNPRQSYTIHFINEENIAIISLLESRVFKDFPDLKIIISHGGGAIPYHTGRFQAWRFRKNIEEHFEDSLRKLYFETCTYNKHALELLFKIVGTDNVLFGTEKPGTGSGFDPKTGLYLDDLKPVIEGIEFLSAEDKHKVFEGNARKIFNLK